MKKHYTLLVFMVTIFSQAQIVNIPDANFKAKLLQADTNNNIASGLKIDANNDGEIQLGEALAVDLLDVSNSSIADLTGIQSFQNLISINCNNNAITHIDISGLTNLLSIEFINNPGLITFNASGCNHLQTIAGYLLSNNALTEFGNFNSLTTINLTNCIALPEISILSCSVLNSLTLTGCTNVSRVFLDQTGLTSLNLSGLSGLHILYFTDNSFLTSLDYTGCNNLTSILIIGSPLAIPFDLHGNTNLVTFFVDGEIPSLNLSGCTNLEVLEISSDSLTSFDISNCTSLAGDFEFGGSVLTSINVSGCSGMTSLNVFGSPLLTSLDASNLSSLTTLNCTTNPLLSSLNVSGCVNLVSIECSGNQLTSLDFTGLTNLAYVNCVDNQLTSLTLTGLINLTTLNCRYNNLTTLDASSLIRLQELDVMDNHLETLFIKNGKNETVHFANNNDLAYICADDSQLAAIQATLDLNAMENTVLNSYCTFSPGGTFYAIAGQTTYDITDDGCGVNDTPLGNVKYKFIGSITQTYISGSDGSYDFNVPAGTYTIMPVMENPNNYLISPASATVTFPTQASPFTQNFCIVHVPQHNDLEISILPLLPARPGFDVMYKIIYKNKGTTVQNGSITFGFDDTVLDFIYASPIASSQNATTRWWNFSNLQPLESREITVTLNLNSPVETPPVTGGHILGFTASVTGLVDETPDDNSTTLNQTVVNSYDPNDKTCIEGETISPSMVGNYVHYMIRFENTGTANAENVVVKDVIDTTKFDVDSLVPISGSAPFVTKIDNNKVEFIFENIDLPFDDANNDGYVAFKIKTKPTLVIGDTFSNTASIYFDYNAPIITNTAMTTVEALGNPDFDFSTLYSLAPVPAKNILNISTKQNVAISSVSIYNTLGQLIQINTSPSTTLDVSNLKTGNYFIKIISDKRTTSGKFIKE